MNKNIAGILSEAQERPTEVFENIRAVHGELAEAFVKEWFAATLYQQKVCATCDVFEVHEVVHQILHFMAADTLRASARVASLAGLSDKVIEELTDTAFELAQSHASVERRLVAEVKKQRSGDGEA